MSAMDWGSLLPASPNAVGTALRTGPSWISPRPPPRSTQRATGFAAVTPLGTGIVTCVALRRRLVQRRADVKVTGETGEKKVALGKNWMAKWPNAFFFLGGGNWLK